MTQGTIRYVHITERTLADVFSNFENIQFLLDVDDAHISGIYAMNVIMYFLYTCRAGIYHACA